MSGAGRPTVYSESIAFAILEQIADGRSLRSICAADDMPGRTTVYRWIFDDVEGFRNQYARAQEIRAHALADELMEIADTPEPGVTITTEADGSQKVVEGDMINHRRLRYDARKWLTSKILPKFYGERITQEVTTENVHRIIGEAPIDKDEWAAKYANGAEPVVVESDDAS